jgi:hypothetical protein
MRQINQFSSQSITTAIALSLATAMLGITTPTIAHQYTQAPKNPMGEVQPPKVDQLQPTGEIQPPKIAPLKMDKSQMGEHHDAEHHHKTVAIPDGQAVPKVSLEVTPDAISGWNLQITLENFRFTPEKVNQESRTTDGHAHLMLNGRKIARLYGTWYHIPSLPQGKNALKVTLNTNKHEEITYHGKAIAAIAVVDVP